MIYINRINNRAYGKKYLSTLDEKYISHRICSTKNSELTSKIKSTETQIVWDYSYNISFLGTMKNRIWYDSGESHSKLGKSTTYEILK